MASVRSRKAFGVGVKLARYSIVVEHRVPQPPVFGNLLLFFSMTKAWVKTSGTSTANWASVLFFCFTGASRSWSLRERLALPERRPCILIIFGLRRSLEYFVLPAKRRQPVLVALKSENAIPLGEIREYLSCG